MKYLKIEDNKGHFIAQSGEWMDMPVATVPPLPVIPCHF